MKKKRMFTPNEHGPLLNARRRQAKWTRGLPYFDAYCSGCERRVEASDDPVWIERAGVTTVICAACVRQARPVKGKRGKITHYEIKLANSGKRN